MAEMKFATKTTVFKHCQKKTHGIKQLFWTEMKYVILMFCRNIWDSLCISIMNYSLLPHPLHVQCLRQLGPNKE